MKLKCIEGQGFYDFCLFSFGALRGGLGMNDDCVAA